MDLVSLCGLVSDCSSEAWCTVGEGRAVFAPNANITIAWGDEPVEEVVDGWRPDFIPKDCYPGKSFRMPNITLLYANAPVSRAYFIEADDARVYIPSPTMLRYTLALAYKEWSLTLATLVAELDNRQPTMVALAYVNAHRARVGLARIEVIQSEWPWFYSDNPPQIPLRGATSQP